MGFVSKDQKKSRSLELSISQNTPHGRWGQGPSSVDPTFPAGLPFPMPEILEFVAFRDSGTIFQQFSRDFPGVFPENPRTDPGNSRSLLEFSERRAKPCFSKPRFSREPKKWLVLSAPSKSPLLRTPPSKNLRWAKSRNSYRRIASESYRCDWNH